MEEFGLEMLNPGLGNLGEWRFYRRASVHGKEEDVDSFKLTGIHRFLVGWIV
jgi:hypothetical protein